MKDNFSVNSDKYARYRPGYPNELFEFLNEITNQKDLAWDCGTGNGQSARSLSKYYKKVYATDISNKQLKHAQHTNNIVYAQEAAEKTSLEENTVDLITVSQELHWFDIPSFYAEVKRVGKQDAVIAVWTYNLLKADLYTDKILHNYHFDILKDYWDPERQHVNDGYSNIPFPFKKINSPAFNIELYWTNKDLEGYLNTWSATQKFIETNHINPVNDLMEKININWKAGETRRIIFPLYLKAGYIH